MEWLSHFPSLFFMAFHWLFMMVEPAGDTSRDQGQDRGGLA